MHGSGLSLEATQRPASKGCKFKGHFHQSTYVQFSVNLNSIGINQKYAWTSGTCLLEESWRWSNALRLFLYSLIHSIQEVLLALILALVVLSICPDGPWQLYLEIFFRELYYPYHSLGQLMQKIIMFLCEEAFIS